MKGSTKETERKKRGEEVMRSWLLVYLAYKFNIYYKYISICSKNNWIIYILPHYATALFYLFWNRYANKKIKNLKDI